jgi:C_GCAxxG_C_C family probable redox protein
MNDKEREQLLDRVGRRAFDNEVNYWGCSQAVLDSLQHHFNIGSEEVFKSASALAGGVGARKEACGALLGGVMAIGLLYGRAKYVDGQIARESTEYLEAQARAGKLCDRFLEKFGSMRCCDVSVNVRGDHYKVFQRYDTVEALEDHDECADVVGESARMAAEVILEPTEVFKPEMDALAAEVVEARKLLKEKRNAA